MISEDINKKKLRQFGFLIGIGLPLLIGFLMPILLGHNLRIWTFWLGGITSFIGFIKPYSLFYFYKLWMKIGQILGWLNSHLMLGFVYFIILLPMSFILKLFGYDPLKLKKTKCKTYRQKKENNMINFNQIF